MNISLKPGAFCGGGAPFLGSTGFPPAAFPPPTLALIPLISFLVLGERLVSKRSSHTFSTRAVCFWLYSRRAYTKPILEKACILSSRS